MEVKPRILVFASGTDANGGSGLLKMVEAASGPRPVLDAHICGVVSNHEAGGVARFANILNIPFEYWPGPFTAEGYMCLYRKYKADYAVLSGWLKKVYGLPLDRTINIHPGPLPLTAGLYGRKIHERVIDAFRSYEIASDTVTMMFVDTSERSTYDVGFVFYEQRLPILADDTPVSLEHRVRAIEHWCQSRILNHVVNGRIRLEDENVLYDASLLHLVPGA